MSTPLRPGTFDPIHMLNDVAEGQLLKREGDNIIGFTPTGTIGPAGPQGPQGIQGPIGPTGATGAQGTPGQPGPQGVQGVQGIQGVSGPAGADGAAGPAGPTGPAGAGSISISAGAVNQTASAITFSNASGVSWGITNGIITATVRTDYQSAGAYLTTARASNDAIGLATAGTNITWTANSAGLSIDAGAYLTTAAMSNHSHGNPTLFLTNLAGTTASASNGLTLSLSATAQSVQTQNFIAVIGSGANGNGTFTSGTLSLKAGDGVTLSTGANVLSFHVATNFLTTAALSNHSHGNPTLNLTNLSGTTASNSAGFTLSLSAAAAGAGGGIAAAAGSQTGTSGTIVFSNSNNVTFGMSNSSVVTASFSILAQTVLSVGSANNSGGTNLPAYAWHDHIHAGVPALVAGSNTGNTSGDTMTKHGTWVLAGSNNITLSGSTGGAGVHTAWVSGPSLTQYLTTAALSNHSHGNPTLNLTNLSGTTASNSAGLTLSLSAAAPGGGATISTYHNHPINILTTVGAPANNSATIMFMPMREAVSATRLEMPVSANVATVANNSSGAILYTLSAYIYTKTGATLNSVSSGSGAATHTWSSNATGSMTGGRFISAALNVNASAGNYFIGLHLSTRATGHAGPNSTSLANTLTMLGVGTGEAGAFTFGAFGAVTASSEGWYTVGLNSSTNNLTQVSLSNVTQAGTGFQRANVALRMYM